MMGARQTYEYTSSRAMADRGKEARSCSSRQGAVEVM